MKPWKGTKMTEQKMVYVLTKGSYSEYQILAVYLDRHEAERAETFYNIGNPYDDAGIEKWPTDGTRPAGSDERWWRATAYRSNKWEVRYAQCAAWLADANPDVDDAPKSGYIEIVGSELGQVLKCMYDRIGMRKAHEEGLA